MLKPVAAVGGALALAGAGAIGAVTLMENFVEAGIAGEAACDENPVGLVGPYTSSLDFGCTAGSAVINPENGITVAETYASFAAPGNELESVPTSEFWPLFPARNYFGLEPTLQAGVDSLVAQFQSIESATVVLAELTVNFTLLDSIPAPTPDQVAAKEATKAGIEQITAGIGAFELLTLGENFESCEKTYAAAGPALLGAAVGARLDPAVEGAKGLAAAGLPNFLGTGMVGFCQVYASGVETALSLQAGTLTPECTGVVDFTAPKAPALVKLRSGTFPNAKSFMDVVASFNATAQGNLVDANSVALVAAKPLAETCIAIAGSSINVTAGQTYADVTITPALCEAALPAAITEPTVSGITGVEDITNVTDAEQLKKLIEKCEKQEEDLAAIEQAQILLPAGAGVAGLSAILLFVAVATGKAPLVLAGGLSGVVGGVLALVALLGVRNAPVYANVGGTVDDSEVEYKSGLGATLGLVGIGAPVVGGLLGAGSFFCTSDEEGGALSSKVDNTY